MNLCQPTLLPTRRRLQRRVFKNASNSVWPSSNEDVGLPVGMKSPSLLTWYSRTKMKMLSAPTASTRKGTTWMITREEGTPR